MIKELDISQIRIATEILAIQRLSYKIEAERIGFWELPPLKETALDLQQSEELFYGYFVGTELGGVISVQIEAGVLDICRLFVHPDHFRKGIGKQLLNYAQADLRGFTAVSVSTATDNIPAIELYQKNGFSKLKQVQTKEGLQLTFLRK